DPPADPNGYSYKFDKWVEQNFLLPYNLDFKYRMEDVESSMDYNLVPATFENARDLCLLTKYLWFDTYAEHCGVDFLKSYGPRILHLIGSPAYNPTSGTEILGLAEGGLKVSLFKVNEIQLTNVNQLNEYYFRTMHHEFGHILHQTRTYPKEFDLISAGRYDASSWQNKPMGVQASQGFITPYASSEGREDFAETIANYLTRTDEADALIMWMADRGWTNGLADDAADVEDAPYYCYYYLKDQSKPDEKTYILTSVEKDGNFRPAIIGTRGESLNTVEAVEAYIERLNASTPGGIFPVEDADKVDGRAIIEQKRSIVRNWFKDTWQLDFDELREIVQRRQ
ncbi:MAG: putative zinc-binding metallopeptidase, partial [Muribaculaceae bacterium]|nr:putative zinc-binding metallopeptidase [Muribaculaceae bacterium]